MQAVLLTVHSVEDVTPHMRRVTFAGDGVRTYLSEDRIPNIKLLLPDDDGTFGVPELDDPASTDVTDVRTVPGLLSRVRTYTVRTFDREASTLAVDFVLHGDEGVASRWAQNATTGSTLCAAGGGGRGIGVAENYLIAGDETGLPAIGSMLENLPADARGVAFVEVANLDERQELRKPEGVELRWLSRGGEDAGTTTLLIDAVTAHTLTPNTFAWVAAESTQVVTIRKYLRAQEVPRTSMLVIGYWRRGLSENGYAKASNHDRDLKEFSDDEHDHGLLESLRHAVSDIFGRVFRR